MSNKLYVTLGMVTGAHGENGQRGEKGETGNTATVGIGTVTTGAVGSSVIVTNTGDSHNAILNFTIPKGDTGNERTTFDGGSF